MWWARYGPSEDVHVLILGTYEHVTLHDKGKVKLQVELRLLDSSPSHREMMLVYLGGRKFQCNQKDP